MPHTVALLGCGKRHCNFRACKILILDNPGNLGSAIATALLDPLDKEGVKIDHLIVTVASKESQERIQKDFSAYASRCSVRLAEENVAAVKEADIVVLSFKPVKRRSVFEVSGFREALQGKLVLSIMAGITLAELNRLASDDDKLQSATKLQAVRVMPNMAARIREASSLYTADQRTITDTNLKTADWILHQFGTAQFIEEESFDISAVLVGCAGSLLLLAIDGLLDAAVAEGVRRPIATQMAMQSAIGMMKLVPQAGEHPSVLREKIASPGGCSIRALLELEERGVRSAFTSALLKAAERSRAMSGT